MHLALLLILAGAVFLVPELLITARTGAKAGCFILPAAALAAFLWTLWRGSAAMGWDTLGWAFLSVAALSALIGALVGGAAGLVFRRRRRKKERQDAEN